MVVLKMVIFKRSSLMSATVTVLVHTATSGETCHIDKYEEKHLPHFFV